jgi:uncharacterized protein (TIGR02001 family)
MKNLTKMMLGAASFASLLSIGAPAMAQDAADFTLSGTVAVQSDYRFRGISQSDRSAAPQGSLTLTGPDGWYISAWGSRVDFDSTNSGNPYMELDIYGGKHTDLWGIFDWNFMPYYYAYPAADIPAGAPGPDYFELINQLTHTSEFGLAGTFTYAWSPKLPFNGGTGNYLALNLTYPINDWLSVSGNFGHQWAQQAKYSGSSDYNHGDVGVTATYQGFSLDLRYTGTDLTRFGCANFYMGTRNACAGGFVGTLSYSFTLAP